MFMSLKVTTFAIVTAITLMAAASASFLTHEAFAKITPAEPPSCTNPGGNQPGGQQPECGGEGLTQNEGSPATNPSGNEPPGQQP